MPQFEIDGDTDSKTRQKDKLQTHEDWGKNYMQDAQGPNVDEDVSVVLQKESKEEENMD